MFLEELTGSPLALAQGGYIALREIIGQAHMKMNIPFAADAVADARKDIQEYRAAAGDLFAAEDNLFGYRIVDGVLVLPVTGLMTKYSGYYTPGMDDIAGLVALAQDNPDISSVILLFNTYGGSTQSWIRMEEVLRGRTKPAVAVVDGMCASAGVYVACFCDKIVALNPTCKIGSIGVMAQMTDTREAEKQDGYRVLEFYPPESKHKNMAERQALDGNDKLLIEETLSPLARHFQQTVRNCRPRLDESVDGLLEGKMFFAPEAMAAGLIDGISTLWQALQEARNMANEQKNILNQVTI